jgi:signal transduction histidine kinase
MSHGHSRMLQRTSGIVMKLQDEEALVFLRSGGAMGALMRSFDFSATPLGPAAEWPQSLRSAVSICLNSRFPIVLFWGPQFVSLYNDAYTPILGNKHPWALGQPFEVVWADIWDVLGPVLRGVFETGVPSWAEDQQLIFHRSGYPEEVYFTFSFGAGRNEQGDVGGIFCAVTETTQRVLHERRLAILKELTADARTTPDAARITADVLAHTPDIPFALLYLKGTDDLHAVLASHCGLPEHSTAAPATLDLNGERESWLLSSAQADGMMVLTDLDRRFGPLPGRPWPEPATSAAVIPLKRAGQSDDAGYLILGISPRRAFDDAYRRFFELVGNHVATMVSNARAYEEERMRAEALAALDRAKTAFFSNVSHEFRTPLTLMLGPVEELLAKSHTDLSPASKGQLEIVNRNGLRLLRLVNSLLDFSRIEAGRVKARYEPTDLATFTIELASSFRSATERAGLTLIVDCPPLSEPIYVDRDMWEKIVLNLVSNAFKFTLEGHIDVRLRQHDHLAELIVRDTGVGIPAEAMPHLFERFYRVDNMRSRTYEGSGIGLALVQELAKLHGGTVRVESNIGGRQRLHCDGAPG